MWYFTVVVFFLFVRDPVENSYSYLSFRATLGYLVEHFLFQLVWPLKSSSQQPFQ